MSILSGIKGWEAVYMIASNAPFSIKTDKFFHCNKEIKSDITAILAMRITLFVSKIPYWW